MREGGGRQTQGLKTTIASDERAHSDNNEPPLKKKKIGRHLNIMAFSCMSIDNKRETIACVGNSKLKDRCIFF